jgi:hypothetical protein
MSSSFLRFSSSELLRPFSSLGLFRAEHHLPRFPSLFATSHTRSNFTRRLTQSRLRSVLRFSQPLDGFLRARARRLISSRCHVQGSICSRASLPAQPPFFVRRSLPPCRCCTVASRACFCFRRNLRAPTCGASRLRGFYLREARVLQARLFTFPAAAPFFSFVSSRSSFSLRRS